MAEFEKLLETQREELQNWSLVQDVEGLPQPAEEDNHNGETQIQEEEDDERCRQLLELKNQLITAKTQIEKTNCEADVMLKLLGVMRNGMLEQKKVIQQLTMRVDSK